MILEFLINIFGNIAIFLIGLLPEFPALGGLLSKIGTSVFDVIHSISFLIDINVVGTCIIVLFIFMNIEFIFAAIMWIIKKIPGVS